MGASFPGTFSLNVLGTYVKEYAVETFGGSPFVDYTGSTVNSSFRYKLFTTLTYSVTRASAGLRWQHLPSISPAPGAASIVQGAPSHDQVDVFGHWALTPTIDLRGGIDNVFNAWPETIGAQTGVNNNVGATIQDYDTIGRRYYVGVRARF
jgi:outer membrane receptor for ferrienterochelin and colicin